MGKELSLARAKEEGRAGLLADTSVRELTGASLYGDQRAQEPNASEVDKGGKVKDTKAKSKSSRKTKRTDAQYSESARRRRDNKNRKSNRGNEGTDKPARRSASELGIAYPDNYCDELKTVPHYWHEVERVDRGSLFQCKFCLRYLWLPMFDMEAQKLSALMRRYGINEGYCRYLNRHRIAKVLVAKLQDLRRLELETADKVKFARITARILSNKEYDRKEVKCLGKKRYIK